ncbi:hypothetical protein K2173_021677 [Erythroxylum novogranatense]|uniref:Remorin C-terminal domain-containing protein n=1 Tax=Erythroxylum novogranatense TaxID=1862640 RepID=A0AAV8TIS7_9ROSI|nr:hypothetical protein K2173_021677 [Erythroxylum novogranatense]
MGEVLAKIDEPVAVSVPEKAVHEDKISTPPQETVVHEERNAANPAPETSSGGSVDREVVLAKVETEKRFSLIKAWEENEKAKIDNKAHKKMATIGAWENTKRVSVEAQFKRVEEKMEKKKAEYAEKMNNRVAEIHKTAEEKKALAEAKRGEEFFKIEETSAKYRARGHIPKNFFGCFGSI